ncbi:MAG: 16S rRNA methyltransferase [Anaerolineae bacterium]|nr:MAG: 16S rRNA methyltransferase [Anaerolineae bacterium]
MADPLDDLVAAVMAAPKYANITPALVRRIAAAELAKGRGLKDALKATRNKLHQVGGAYLGGKMDYASWARRLEDAADEDALKAECRAMMKTHASSRERLPHLEEFYAVVFGAMGPVTSVLDVACGLNPLALPWMPPGITYYATDIYTDMTAFCDAFRERLGRAGRVWASDVLGAPPDVAVDAALVLKTLPCLEQVDKEAGSTLLRSLKASRIIVSFPVASLGGRDKGMASNYSTRFEMLAAEESWQVERLDTPGELTYLLNTAAA